MSMGKGKKKYIVITIILFSGILFFYPRFFYPFWKPKNIHRSGVFDNVFGRNIQITQFSPDGKYLGYIHHDASYYRTGRLRSALLTMDDSIYLR